MELWIAASTERDTVAAACTGLRHTGLTSANGTADTTTNLQDAWTLGLTG